MICVGRSVSVTLTAFLNDVTIRDHHGNRATMSMPTMGAVAT